MSRGIAPGLLATALLVSAVAVQAQDNLTPRFSSFGPEDLSGSAPGDDFIGGGLHDGQDPSPWRISGDMRVSPFVSLELGYQNFGGSGERPVFTDTTAWSLSGLLSLPLDSGLAPYARLGQMFWATTDSPGDLSSSPDGTHDLYYGLGLRYGLADQLNLHFDYERFSQEESEYDIGSMKLRLSF